MDSLHVTLFLFGTMSNRHFDFSNAQFIRQVHRCQVKYVKLLDNSLKKDFNCKQGFRNQTHDAMCDCIIIRVFKKKLYGIKKKILLIAMKIRTCDVLDTV